MLTKWKEMSDRSVSKHRLKGKYMKTDEQILFHTAYCSTCCSHRSDRLLEHCSIALVGKYTKFSDSYASVIKALEHSALAISHKLEVKVRTQTCYYMST